MAKIRAVCIERQYCSGGREIGKLAAKELGITCYDKTLAQLTAEKLGVTYEEIVNSKVRGNTCKSFSITRFLQKRHRQKAKHERNCLCSAG